MKKKILTLLMTGIMLFAACGEIAGNPTAAANAETEKYNAYTELINYISGWFDLYLNSYFDHFDEHMDPNPRTDFNRRFSTARENNLDMVQLHGQHIRRAVRYADRDPDWGTVDEAVVYLSTAVETVMQLIWVEMEAYYYYGLHEEDNFAKGREMQQRLFHYIGDMQYAFDEFMYQFQWILMQHQGADLPRFYESNMMIRFYTLRLLLTAQEIVWLEGTPITEIEEQTSLFLSDLEALREIVHDSARQSREGYGSNDGQHLIMFMTAINNMGEIIETAIENGSPIAMTRFNRDLDFLIVRYNLMIN